VGGPQQSPAPPSAEIIYLAPQSSRDILLKGYIQQRNMAGGGPETALDPTPTA
jgi:hypothetical protein